MDLNMQNENKFIVVILAAGKGTRMKSKIPKVCHKVGNIAMISRIVKTASKIYPDEIIIVVSENNKKIISKCVKNDLGNHVETKITYKVQKLQLGTGHAVITAINNSNKKYDVLVLLGDTPLIKQNTLARLVNSNTDASIVGFISNNSNTFGRIVLDKGIVSKIVEYNDANDVERKINLCNSGMLWIKKDFIHLLYKISNENTKKEYYLTDIVNIMTSSKLNVGIILANDEECLGANTKKELEYINNIFCKQ